MGQSKGRFHLSQPSVVPILTFLSENLGFHKMEKLSGGRGATFSSKVELSVRVKKRRVVFFWKKSESGVDFHLPELTI